MSRDKTRVAAGFVSYLLRSSLSLPVSSPSRRLLAAKQGFPNLNPKNTVKSPYFGSIPSTGFIHQSLSVRPTRIRPRFLSSESDRRSVSSGMPSEYAQRLRSSRVVCSGMTFAPLRSSVPRRISEYTLPSISPSRSRDPCCAAHHRRSPGGRRRPGISSPERPAPPPRTRSRWRSASAERSPRRGRPRGSCLSPS